MVNADEFVRILKEQSFEFFCGVPDSLLKVLISALPNESHIVAANEGTALSIACGYYLATHKTPVVYLQNSGLGNLANPLASLSHSSVFDIPVLYIIGWRGEPGISDEPQHIVQGEVSERFLGLLGVCHKVLDAASNVDEEILSARKFIKKNHKSYALLVRKNTFIIPHDDTSVSRPVFSRHEAMSLVTESLSADDYVVSTTGMISRELYELCKNRAQKNYFYTLGSMGHASQIALGLALNCKHRVFVFDGDGAFIMHMGGVATISQMQPKNYYHIVFNNGAHDSVGGQATAGFAISIRDIALAAAYPNAFIAKSRKELIEVLPAFFDSRGPSLLEIQVDRGAQPKVGRPHESPRQLKHLFMKALGVLGE